MTLLITSKDAHNMAKKRGFSLLRYFKAPLLFERQAESMVDCFTDFFPLKPSKKDSCYQQYHFDFI